LFDVLNAGDSVYNQEFKNLQKYFFVLSAYQVKRDNMEAECQPHGRYL